MVGSDAIYYTDEYKLTESKEGEVYITLSIQLDEELNITNESFYVSYQPFSGEDAFELIPIYSQSNVIKRFKNNEVQEVRIKNEINYENNEISSTEESISKRALKANEISDISGNVYTTVTIGNQVWMAENLRAESFNDGTVVMTLNAAQWANTPSPGIIDKNSEGYYYNYYVLTNENKNICPQNFWTPTEKDIAQLYNNITPYDEKIKITMNGVKKKVYSPWLAPIVAPIASMAHLAWWTFETSLAGAVITASVATDLSYLIPWAAADLFVLGPLTGWSTKNKQRKNALLRAKYNSVYMDTLGYSLRLNNKGKWIQTNFIPKKNWEEFKLAAINPDSSLVEINSNEARIRMASNVGDADYRLSYNAFPTLKFRFNLTSFLFDEVSLDYEQFMAVRPYRAIEPNDYPNQKYRSKSFKVNSRHQPVLTLLLENGINQEFSNQYNFNLSHENSVKFPSTMKQRKSDATQTGIAYELYGNPSVWGIKNKGYHELFNNWLNMSDNIDANKIATQIRCVSYLRQ